MTYSVEDWLELQYKIEIFDCDMDWECPNNRDMLEEFKKASDFIKETLRIRTKPIVTVILENYVYINIYVMNTLTGKIKPYQMRGATEMEMRLYDN